MSCELIARLSVLRFHSLSFVFILKPSISFHKNLGLRVAYTIFWKKKNTKKNKTKKKKKKKKKKKTKKNKTKKTTTNKKKKKKQKKKKKKKKKKKHKKHCPWLLSYKIFGNAIFRA